MPINYNKFNIIHIFLISLFPVLFIYSQNIDETPVQEIVLPALLILFGAVLLWLLTRFIIKNNEKSAFIISLLLVLSFSYGHIYLLVDDFTLGDSDLGRHRYLLIPFVISFVVGTYYFVKTKVDLNNMSTIFNVFAASILVIILINVATYNLENIDSFENEVIAPPSVSLFDTTIETISSYHVESKSHPDVYYIILDAYTSSNSLNKFLNYDNYEFVSYLTDKGFTVNHNSYSNYPSSLPSITSTFNMMYLNSLTDGQIGPQELHISEKMISEGPVMQNFKSAGYDIIILHRPFTEMSSSSLFDLELCKRNQYIDSQLLSLIIRTSVLGFVLEKSQEQEMRETALCNFSELPKQHKAFDKPIFVVSHILIPHPPYLFDPDGNPVDSIRPQGLEDWDYKEGYINSVKFANKKIIQVVDELLTDSENPPVIIIQADHGSQFDFDSNNPSNENIEQVMSNFSAYYLPGIEKYSSNDVITPVNTFRIIFNSYFNTDYDLLENKMYWINPAGTSDDAPEYFIDVTDILITP